MKITKEIEVNATKKGKLLIINDLATLSMALGTSSVSGNIHMYPGLKKVGTHWEVPLSTIEDRVQVVEQRIKRDQAKVSLMKQFL